MSITRPTLEQQENSLKMAPDQYLQQKLMELTQAGQIGSPQYILLSGEMLARKKVRAANAAQGGDKPSVIEELLYPEQQVQPQQQMPVEAGVAALPAQNLEMLDQPEYAAGGIVAFQGGDEVRSPIGRWFGDLQENLIRAYQTARTPTERQRIQNEMEKNAIRPWEAVTDAEYERRNAEMKRLQEQLKGLGANASATAGSVMPADVASGEFADKALAARGIAYTPKTPPAANTQGIAQLPAAGAAPTATGGGQFSSVKRFMNEFYPASTETVPTEAQAVANRRAALEAAGVNMDPTKELREKIMADRESRATDKERAGWEALAQFGLTLASTPGQFLAAVGQAGLPALKQYSAEIKDLKKAAREDERLLSQLNTVDNELKLKVTQSGLDERQKIVDRLEQNKARAGQIAATVYGSELSLQASKESKAAQKDDRLVKQAQDAAIKVVNEGVTKFGSPTEKEAEISRLTSVFYKQLKDLQSGKVSPATSTARGRVVNGVYVPAGQ